MSEVLPVDSGVDALAVFMASGGTTDVVNRNSPATPPNTLNLRSSHNELLNAEIRHTETKNSTPPKCRKKYALTNIQTAMGLSDPAAQPLLGNSSANIKLVKNGENQLRKAAEQGQQDPNRNLGSTAGVNVTSEKFESNEPIPHDSSGCEILPSQPRRTKSFLNYYADLETSARDLEQGFVVMEDKSAQSNSQASTVIVNGEVLPRKQNKMPSPEDGQVATVSSSPETKKDHPKTGAKTDCALHRIQNLAPSDEDSSWTTLSQDSASPSSPDETEWKCKAWATVVAPVSICCDPSVRHSSGELVSLLLSEEKADGGTIPGIDGKCIGGIKMRSSVFHGLYRADIWSDHSFQTDPDLPPGWKKINDIAGIYYWHIPTGTTQWQRPVSIPTDLQGSRKGSLGSITPSPTPENEDLHAATVNPDPSLKEFEGATLRYASLKLRNGPQSDDDDSCSINSDPEAKVCMKIHNVVTINNLAVILCRDSSDHSRYCVDLHVNLSSADIGLQWERLRAELFSASASAPRTGQCFAVRSLGWVEMAEEDLAPGKSSVAVNNCIRQLSYCKNDIRDTVGIWGEGKDMYLILENDMLNLIDPMDRTVLHSQPIVSIRVWGVGRDNGRLGSDNLKRLVGSFSLEITGVISQTALLAHLKEKFPRVDKSDSQGGVDPCPPNLGLFLGESLSSPCIEEE
ncbi:amyloid beta precursor protein binding family B member 2 [Turdus rufiventris]|nr:amyloid beta precursor protein binding family B member 2 [Turdus rufiventris]